MHIYWTNVVRQKNKYVLKTDMSDCYSISNITQLKYNENKIYHSDHLSYNTYTHASFIHSEAHKMYITAYHI